MQTIKRILARGYVIAMTLCAIASSTVRAQTVAMSAPTPQASADTNWMNCRANYHRSGAYSNCALRIDFNKLRQGDSLRIVSKRHVLRPLKIADFVQGDSALYYAKTYHRAEMWRTGLVGAGAALVGVAFATRYLCPEKSADAQQAPKMSVCSHSSSVLRNPSLYTGGGLLVASIPFRVSAYRASHKAVDLYNAALGR